MLLNRYSYYITNCGECKARFKFKVIASNWGKNIIDIHNLPKIHCIKCGEVISERYIVKDAD